MAVYSRSSMQNINNRGFRIRKNKCIIEFNRKPTRHYLYAKDPYEAKYQYFINKREGVGIDHFTTLKLLLSIQTICIMFTKILIDKYNPAKENKILIVFDDMTADMINN